MRRWPGRGRPGDIIGYICDMELIGKGRTAEEAVEALKECLWREIWKECVEPEGVVLEREGEMWIAKIEGSPVT